MTTINVAELPLLQGNVNDVPVKDRASLFLSTEAILHEVRCDISQEDPDVYIVYNFVGVHGKSKYLIKPVKWTEFSTVTV